MTTDPRWPETGSPPPPVPPPPAAIADAAYRTEADRLAAGDTLESRIERVRAEVDALQVSAMRSQRPWYREIASIVAVLALAFSFGTTFVSYDRTLTQDAHDKRVELRTLIDRVSAISQELTVDAATYRNDPATASSLNRYLNQEQILDAKQAERIMEAIPDQVGASEYTLVAVVLISNSIDNLGIPLLTKAVAASRDANDRTGALRYLASRRFQLGQAGEGRRLYDQATHVFDLNGGFPSQDNGYIAATQFDTQASWSFSELHYGDCDLAKEHFTQAQQFATTFAANDPRLAQLATFSLEIASCSSQPNPSPGSSPISPFQASPSVSP